MQNFYEIFYDCMLIKFLISSVFFLKNKFLKIFENSKGSRHHAKQIA